MHNLKAENSKILMKSVYAICPWILPQVITWNAKVMNLNVMNVNVMNLNVKVVEC